MEEIIKKQQEIESTLRNMPKDVLKNFQQVNSLLALWQECESHIKNTQYPMCAPNWFYHYVNSL